MALTLSYKIFIMTLNKVFEIRKKDKQKQLGTS